MEAAREHVSALDAEAEAEAAAAAAVAASVRKAAEAEADSRQHEQQTALQDRYEHLASVREAGRQRQEAEAQRKKQRRVDSERL
jgi:hypothetical protein